MFMFKSVISFVVLITRSRDKKIDDFLVKIIVLILGPKRVGATPFGPLLCKVWSFVGRRPHYCSILLPEKIEKNREKTVVVG